MDWQRQYIKLVRFDYIAHAPTQWGYKRIFFVLNSVYYIQCLLPSLLERGGGLLSASIFSL
jgi:hypothetical protein